MTTKPRAAYDASFGDALRTLRGGGVTHVVLGDILFEERRPWAETISATDLFAEWTSSGAEALIVTTPAERLAPSWLGRAPRQDMLHEFRQLGVDPCGERGEYHTVVTDRPLFRSALRLRTGARVQR